MGKCPEKFVEYMHEYLDDELSSAHEAELRQHLQTCEECQKHFHELKKTIALVQSTAHIQAPNGFTANVMSRLPKENKMIRIQRWFRAHPLLTAASLFIFLMMGSLASSFKGNDDFSVTNHSNLIVNNNTVIVPEGETVKGDIVVKNGKIRIEGKVEGNVTVINGAKYLASAGEVTGQIHEINEAFSWIWFKIKNTFYNVVEAF
ncbi:anti-sigma factor family protein [Bacillus litorisediminis]|uniref:anti-sigma factor family protein n=1 Tax=Bacillus litorisediminis TaxID=2922713 RepID=UPI00243516AB|nr:anti-sigma factor [Bacillus litorisediminis]